MGDPFDATSEPPSVPGNSYKAQRRPRPKKSLSIWMVAIVVMFLIIIGAYVIRYSGGTTSQPSPGPVARPEQR